jgi:hypothetical protein
MGLCTYRVHFLKLGMPFDLAVAAYSVCSSAYLLNEFSGDVGTSIRRHVLHYEIPLHLHLQQSG